MMDDDTKKVDPYGFKLNDDYDYDVHSEFMSKYLSILARRKKKWVDLLEHKKPSTRNYKVKRYVRKGIPSENRGMMWATMSGAMDDLDQNPGVYVKALSSKKDDDIINSISLDIPRTYPDNVHFQSMDEGHLGSLFNVLVAFAHQYQDVGYCQGLNYIAGLLLLIVEDEEITFWLLSRLVKNILPDYYVESMEGLLTDMDVLGELVKLKLPRISAHIERVGGTWSLIASKWFICLYAEVLPIETVFRIWDSLMYEGDKILFRVALTLLKQHEEQIISASDLPRVVECFKRLPQDPGVINCHEFMEAVFKEPGVLSRKLIEKLRRRIQMQKVSKSEPR